MNWKRNWQVISTLGSALFVIAPWTMAQEKSNKQQTELVDKFDKILGVNGEKNTKVVKSVDTVVVDNLETINRLKESWKLTEKKFLVTKYNSPLAVEVEMQEQLKDLKESVFVTEYFPETKAEHVYFSLDKNKVDMRLFGELQNWANQMKANPSWILVLNGYTDVTGDVGYNQQLGMQRANFVKQYMVQTLGADANQIETNSYGEVGGDRVLDAEMDFLNRRVDLLWKK